MIWEAKEALLSPLGSLSHGSLGLRLRSPFLVSEALDSAGLALFHGFVTAVPISANHWPLCASDLEGWLNKGSLSSSAPSPEVGSEHTTQGPSRT